MLLIAIGCLTAALWCFYRMIPLVDRKNREGSLFVEDEEKLRRLRRRVYLLSGLSLLFLLAAMPELL